MLIAYATDLSGADDRAFVHATALAVTGAARLVAIHANPEDVTATSLPDAEVLAARWGRTILYERRCHECCDDVADTVLDALHGLQPNLVVVGTHARHGVFAALSRSSVGQTIARNIDVPVLVVPNRARGFVNAETGHIDLSRIVIPAGNREDAQRGIDAARALVALACTHADLEIVHVGDDELVLSTPGVTVTRVAGKLEDAILEFAGARRACVIVMPTRGHDGLGDVVLGSHTERVIREAGCPVLSVPIT